MTDDEVRTEQFRDGRAQGLAIAALALGLVSFLNLLGAEKAILVLILALSALRNSRNSATRRQASMAIGLSIVYVLTIAVVLLVFGNELAELLSALRALG